MSEFVWSDAWLLLSLIYGDGPLDLKRICDIGDFINHAIFTQHELQSGLRRLVAHGHATKVDNQYAATPRVMEWYTSITGGKRRTYVFKDLERVEEFLGLSKRRKRNKSL